MPECKFLQSEERHKFHEKVNRESLNTKLIDFVTECP